MRAVDEETRHVIRRLDEFRIQSLSRKGCMAKGLAGTPCAGKVARAHVVSKASTLKPIAQDGHLLRYDDRFDFTRFPYVKFDFFEVGVGRATTFYGFCARHDRELFSCVENEGFDARPDQCFALAYRAVAHEIHSRAGSDRFLGGVAQRVPVRHAAKAQNFAATTLRGQQAARDGILLTAAGFSTLLPKEAKRGAEHLVIRYGGVLPFAFGGAFAPMWDFENRKFQSIGAGEPASGYLALNTATAVGRSHVVLSWLIEAKPRLRTLLCQIQSMPLATAGHAVLEMALEGLGTLVFSPGWVRSLDPQATTALERLLVHGKTYAPGPTPWIGIARCPDIPRATSLAWVA